MTDSEGRTLTAKIALRNVDAASSVVVRALQLIRAHLRMEIAYVSEFEDGREVFREVVAPGEEDLIKVGDSHSLDDTYCRFILEGRLPQLICDTSTEPIAMALPVTKMMPIGRYMSVPILRSDGQPYGMFCCLGFKADLSLNDRDLNMMNVFSDLVAFEINDKLKAKADAAKTITRIRRVVEDNRMTLAYQPIFKIGLPRPIGMECLSRFPIAPPSSPSKWFTDATEVGLGQFLEFASIRLAASSFHSLPSDAFLAINVSPATILTEEFAGTLEGLPPNRIILEVTEHVAIKDYEALIQSLRLLRSTGVRLAIDDAGAGYASLRHILHLAPDVIKLDMCLIRHIDVDPARRALVSAMVGFARDTNCQIVAEGVETDSELRVMQELGVEIVQGYFLGRPMTLDRLLNLFDLYPVQDSCVA
ncbi:EAL domain-containing protein (putative c-di-GMP-specific phosphodiesterase class I) [Nitrobacteraceae bacterium AZCC 2146]